MAKLAVEKTTSVSIECDDTQVPWRRYCMSRNGSISYPDPKRAATCARLRTRPSLPSFGTGLALRAKMFVRNAPKAREREARDNRAGFSTIFSSGGRWRAARRTIEARSVEP